MAQKKSTANDIDAIGEVQDTYTFDLRHPITDEVIYRNDGDPMQITVWSEESDHMKRIANAQANRMLQKSLRAGKVKATVEQTQANQLELICASVKSWTIVVGGETPAVEMAAIKDLFEKRPWIRKQVEAAGKEQDNFIKA